MRGKTARRLRKLAYQQTVLVPGQPDRVQEYKGDLLPATFRFFRTVLTHVNGVLVPKKIAEQGTIRCTGVRRTYQVLKKRLKDLRRQPQNGHRRCLEELLK